MYVLPYNPIMPIRLLLFVTVKTVYHNIGATGNFAPATLWSVQNLYVMTATYNTGGLL